MNAKLSSRTLFFTVLFSVALLLIVRCEFKNRKLKDQLVLVDNQQMEVSIQDAKLLVDVTKENIEVLRMCQEVQNSTLKNDLKTIQVAQHNINSNLNQLGMKKLIMLPDSFLQPFQLKEIDFHNGRSREATLKCIEEKIKRQLTLFEILEKNTTDVDIKVLAIQSKTQLELNLLQLEYIKTSTNS